MIIFMEMEASVIHESFGTYSYQSLLINCTGRQLHSLYVCWMNLVKVPLQKVSLAFDLKFRVHCSCNMADMILCINRFYVHLRWHWPSWWNHKLFCHVWCTPEGLTSSFLQKLTLWVTFDGLSWIDLQVLVCTHLTELLNEGCLPKVCLARFLPKLLSFHSSKIEMTKILWLFSVGEAQILHHECTEAWKQLHRCWRHRISISVYIYIFFEHWLAWVDNPKKKIPYLIFTANI